MSNDFLDLMIKLFKEEKECLDQKWFAERKNTHWYSSVNKFFVNYWPGLEKLTIKEIIDLFFRTFKEYSKAFDSGVVGEDLMLKWFVISGRISKFFINAKSVKLRKIAVLAELRKRLEKKDFLKGFNFLKADFKDFDLIRDDKFIGNQLSYALLKAKSLNNASLFTSVLDRITGMLENQLLRIENYYELVGKDLLLAVLSNDLGVIRTIINSLKAISANSELVYDLTAEYRYIDKEHFDTLTYSVMLPEAIDKFINEKLSNDLKGDKYYMINLAHGSTKLAALITIGLRLKGKQIDWDCIRMSSHKEGDDAPVISNKSLKNVISKVSESLSKECFLLFDEDICSGESIEIFLEFLRDNSKGLITDLSNVHVLCMTFSRPAFDKLRKFGIPNSNVHAFRIE